MFSSRSITVSDQRVISLSSHVIFSFLKNMEKHYLQIHSGHMSFKVRGNMPLQEGAIIDNEERAFWQYVSHVYTVVRVKKNSFIELYSSNSIVKFLGLSLPVSVKVCFRLTEMESAQTSLLSEIIIIFPNKMLFLLASLVGTKPIWASHLRQEIDGGVRVLLGSQ